MILAREYSSEMLGILLKKNTQLFNLKIYYNKKFTSSQVFIIVFHKLTRTLRKSIVNSLFI